MVTSGPALFVRDRLHMATRAKIGQHYTTLRVNVRSQVALSCEGRCRLRLNETNHSMQPQITRGALSLFFKTPSFSTKQAVCNRSEGPSQMEVNTLQLKFEFEFTSVPNDICTTSKDPCILSLSQICADKCALDQYLFSFKTKEFTLLSLDWGVMLLRLESRGPDNLVGDIVEIGKHFSASWVKESDTQKKLSATLSPTRFPKEQPLFLHSPQPAKAEARESQSHVIRKNTSAKTLAVQLCI